MAKVDTALIKHFHRCMGATWPVWIHDIRNSLNTVITGAQLLAKDSGASKSEVASAVAQAAKKIALMCESVAQPRQSLALDWGACFLEARSALDSVLEEPIDWGNCANEAFVVDGNQLLELTLVSLYTVSEIGVGAISAGLRRDETEAVLYMQAEHKGSELEAPSCDALVTMTELKRFGVAGFSIVDGRVYCELRRDLHSL